MYILVTSTKPHHAGFKNESTMGSGHLFSYPTFCAANQEAVQHTLHGGCRFVAEKGKHTERKNYKLLVLYLKHEFAFHILFLKAALVYGEPLLTGNNKK